MDRLVALLEKTASSREVLLAETAKSAFGDADCPEGLWTTRYVITILGNVMGG